MYKIRLLGLVLVLLAGTAIRAAGQTDPGPCDTCWKHFVYDSAFFFYGHQVAGIADGAERFRFNGSQIYGQSLTRRLTELDVSDNLIWIEDPTNPWGGYWNDTVIDPARTSGFIVNNGLKINEGQTIDSVLRKREMYEALSRGFTLTLVPDPFGGISSSTLRSENYLVTSAELQFNQLTESPVNGNHDDMRATLDGLVGGFFWAYTIPDTSVADTVLMAGRPEFNRPVFAVPLTDTVLHKRVYDAIYHIWHDSNGNARPQPVADSLADSLDRRTFYDVGFAMWAHPDSLANIEIDTNAVIAFADLYVRDRVEGPTAVDTSVCLCNMMRRIGRIEITKAEYVAATVVGSPTYRVAHENDGLIVYHELDTLIDFAPWMPIVSQNFGWGAGPNDSLILYDSNHVPIGTTINPCSPWCVDRLAERQAMDDTAALYLPPDAYLAKGEDDADFSWKFYTTRIVPVSFFRGSIAQHLYGAVARGDADHVFEGVVDSVYADPRLDSLIGRLAVDDEPNNTTFRTMGLLSAKLQQAMDADSIGQLRPKPIWTNPQGNMNGFRLYSGDFDSTEFRTVHTAARQVYPIAPEDPTPVYYLNPDSLGIRAWDTVFSAASIFDKLVVTVDGGTGDTISIDSIPSKRRIAGNSIEDYEGYNEIIQDEYFGSYREKDTKINPSGIVGGVAQLVDAMRFRYRTRFPNIPSSPVWSVVQAFGKVGDKEGYDSLRSWRIPTPEEMIAQCWLSVNSGASGIVFADVQLGAWNVGFMTEHIQDPNLYNTMEYGRLRYLKGDDAHHTHLDSMWLGLRSRRAAVAEVGRDLHYVDSVIGWKNLEYRQEQVSLHDQVQSAEELPMVESIVAERAKRYDFSYNAGTDEWTFTGSDTIDAPEETYMDVTHFTPLPGAGTYFHDGSRFLLFTNRRCWPVDNRTYGDSAVNRFARLAPYTPFSTTGLGAIDVRRPVVSFSNATDLIADSMIVELIAPDRNWSDTVPLYTEVELPWMLPGRGYLLRTRPYAAAISDHGTAYNNAVRAENPSDDSTDRDRLVVYERDSAVYMRAVDGSGTWSKEVMISDAADTVTVGGERFASNFFPALAASRTTPGLVRVVWERLDTAGLRSVRSLMLYDTAINRVNLPEVVVERSYRHTLLPPSAMGDVPALTPSIVSVDDSAGTGGFVVSWAGPVSGVTVMALRELTTAFFGGANDDLASYDTAVTRRVRSIAMVDSLCQYPTLAHVPRFERIDTTNGWSAGTPAEKEPAVLGVTIPKLVWLNRVHLAHQQGDGVESQDERIYYHPVGVIFPPQPISGSFIPPGLYVGTAEHVSEKIEGCTFLHPSIAADSARIGVAFEIVSLNAQQKNIALRFRDSLSTTYLKSWTTTEYTWNGPLKEEGQWLVSGAVYERPSVTQFPSLDSLTLSAQMEGGLTWYGNDSTERAFPQLYYRYGWVGQRDIGDGKHPTMMLTPKLTTNPSEGTGVFHRSGDSSRVAGENGQGEDVWHYHARLLNTPGNPIGYFSLLPSNAVIQAKAKFIGFPDECTRVRTMDFGFMFQNDQLVHPGNDLHGPGDPPILPPTPGLPPSFFQAPGKGATQIDTASHVGRVVRTSLFTAGNGPVQIRRFACGGPRLDQWLDGYGYDSVRNEEANIWLVTELVRGTDSVVLWRSDSITARQADSTHTPIDELLSIPVSSVADSGTPVFIRMNAIVTDGVVYNLHGGFAFFAGDQTGGGFMKLVRSGEEEEGRLPAPGSGARSLDLRVVPNPAREQAQVHVRVAAAGEIRLSIWSTSGERLAPLPNLSADGAGEYVVDISVSAVPAGIYILRAEQAGRTSSVRFAVVR